MFDVSLPWASFWYDAFNVMLFIGAFAVAVGTYGSIKMGAVKERFSDERTTSLETQTSQAKAELGKAQADIARANEAIAIATARAAEANQKAEEERLARVKIEAQIAPRQITQEQQNELTDRLKEFSVRETTLTASPSTSENEWLVRGLGAPLAAAGWNIKIFPGTATATILFPRGVVIHAHIAPDALYFPDKEQTGDMAAADRLAKSLTEFGIEATALPKPDVPPGHIRVIVNSR